MKTITYISLFLIFACNPINQPNNQNIHQIPKATPTDCKLGCDYLKTLKGRDGEDECEEARDLIYQNGKIETCEQFCMATESNGRSLNPKCWRTVSACIQIESLCRSPY